VSRYIKTIIFILIFSLTGCSLKEAEPLPIGQKSFETEDYLILSALEYQKNGQEKSAIELYQLLYKKSSKVHYIIEAAKIAFIGNDREATKKLLDIGLKAQPQNGELRRILIGEYIKEKNYKSAEKEILELLKTDKSIKNLKIAGTIYFQLSNHDLALKYFESAYKVNNDGDILLNIIDILYNYLDRKDEAVAYLETHIRMQSCELNTCFKLIEIYGREKNIDGIISTYKKLYERFGDEKYAKKVVELLVYEKDQNGAIRFLENSGYNQKMLLQIYVSMNNFKSAYKVAQKLFKATAMIDYMGRMAIYEYELNRNNMTKEILDSISSKFEKVILTLHRPLYYNYYGYLLIDHDLDINKGIGLVQEALLKEPNSPFYLDSLAWGLYKQGKCKKAKEIMDTIIKNLKDEEEVMMHYNKIQECIEKK
jgi:tetratricopeptide (TPR) repeat protein